jgi:hypothetical protein
MGGVLLITLGTFTEEHSASAQEEVSFRVRWDLQVEGWSGPVAVDDFNDDGHPDQAIVNANGTLSVLLGQEDGTFTAAEDVEVGTVPTTLTAADFNGDDYPDLAMTDADGAVSILLGQGDGTFTAAGDIEGGDVPTTRTVDDFNGDDYAAQTRATSTHCTNVVNACVRLGPPRGASTQDANGRCPAGYDKIYRFNARLSLLPGFSELTDLRIVVTRLSNNNLLRNTASGRARRAPARVGGLPPTLQELEFLTVPFRICLKDTDRFILIVNVRGVVK